MEGEKFSSACRAVIDIAGQPVDEMEMALFAFDDDHARWPGPKLAPAPKVKVQASVAPDAVPRAAPGSKKPPPGWAALPSKEAVDHASAWLAGRAPDGGTRIIPVLRAALAEPRKELTIVLVTDGQFYQERGEMILAAVEKAQQARVKQGLGRALILVFGVGDVSDILKKLGKVGKGGLYRNQVAAPAPVPAEPDPPPLPPAPGKKPKK